MKEESSLRKALIGVLTGALFFAAVGVALALTNNTAEYSAAITKANKTKLGTNMQYEGILHVSTSDNKQPNTAGLTDVYFAKQLKNNSKIFPACNKSDIDGKQDNKIPAKCEKAHVGDGTASSLVGAPGNNAPPCSPPGCSIRQDLTVKVYNGNKGKSVFLAVTGGPVTNRVIDGKISKASGAFGNKVGFQVPAELQNVLGSQIALTDFDVKLFPKKKAVVKIVKGKGKKRKVTKVKVSYLQLTKCPASGTLPTRAVVHFNKDDGSAGGQEVTSDNTSACK
jgi:hypothetical protein